MTVWFLWGTNFFRVLQWLFGSTDFWNQTARMAQWLVRCEKERVCKLQKLGLFLDTIRSTGAPSFIIEVEMGWSLLWGQTDVWVIFWIGMRTTPGILYCTPILLFRTNSNTFQDKTIQKYKSRGWFRYYGWPEQKQYLRDFLQ